MAQPAQAQTERRVAEPTRGFQALAVKGWAGQTQELPPQELAALARAMQRGMPSAQVQEAQSAQVSETQLVQV